MAVKGFMAKAFGRKLNLKRAHTRVARAKVRPATGFIKKLNKRTRRLNPLSGQDVSILGTTSGVVGGHAGIGQPN